MSTVYLHPSICRRPATVAALELVTGLRAVWTGTRAMLRPGHGTLNRQPIPRRSSRPKPWSAS